MKLEFTVFSWFKLADARRLENKLVAVECCIDSQVLHYVGLLYILTGNSVLIGNTVVLNRQIRLVIVEGKP